MTPSNQIIYRKGATSAIGLPAHEVWECHCWDCGNFRRYAKKHGIKRGGIADV